MKKREKKRNDKSIILKFEDCIALFFFFFFSILKVEFHLSSKLGSWLQPKLMHFRLVTLRIFLSFLFFRLIVRLHNLVIHVSLKYFFFWYNEISRYWTRKLVKNWYLTYMHTVRPAEPQLRLCVSLKYFYFLILLFHFCSKWFKFYYMRLLLIYVYI